MLKLYKDITYNGKETSQFENLLCEFTGAKNTVVTNNGTNALFLILKALGIKKGDKVITQAYSFIATANAIKYCDADIVFVDVNSQGCMCPESLNDALNEYNDIKAIVPVHLYGSSCDMPMIMNIANGIPVIEDACQGLNVYNGSQHVGTFGIAGCLSFNGGKLINTGGGGAVLTNDDELAKKIFYLSTTAKDYNENVYYHNELGYNMRMPALNAIYGIRQLKNIQEIVETKIIIERKPYQPINEMPMYKDCACVDLPVTKTLSLTGKGLAYENCFYTK